MPSTRHSKSQRPDPRGGSIAIVTLGTSARLYRLSRYTGPGDTRLVAIHQQI